MRRKKRLSRPSGYLPSPPPSHLSPPRPDSRAFFYFTAAPKMWYYGLFIYFFIFFLFLLLPPCLSPTWRDGKRNALAPCPGNVMWRVHLASHTHTHGRAYNKPIFRVRPDLYVYVYHENRSGAVWSIGVESGGYNNVWRVDFLVCPNIFTTTFRRPISIFQMFPYGIYAYNNITRIYVCITHAYLRYCVYYCDTRFPRACTSRHARLSCRPAETAADSHGENFAATAAVYCVCKMGKTVFIRTPYAYIYIIVCVCVCVSSFLRPWCCCSIRTHRHV